MTNRNKWQDSRFTVVERLYDFVDWTHGSEPWFFFSAGLWIVGDLLLTLSVG